MAKTTNDFFTLDYSKILPTNDLIFKRIFWNKDHPDILICFLNAVLKREDPITSVELISTEFDNQFILDHGIRMDLLGRTNNGELLNIEMQKKNNGDMYKRTLYYWAKLYYSQLPKGEKYGVLNPVIVINILDFNLFKDNRCHRNIVLKDNETNEEYLDRMLDMHFVELRKREHINNNDALRAWMEFLKSPNSASVNNKKEIIPEIEKAKDVYNEAIADPEEQAKIRAIEKAESDKATEIGFAEAKVLLKV
ncbi:MAG: Rpn family recombination-promoting nuclease/putative transposase [Lachnospiraceae bacterium]|nr:Rpn family recombination-promoting nuclease/putative transposase [Lachnospiraceae bacterium]